MDDLVSVELRMSHANFTDFTDELFLWRAKGSWFSSKDDVEAEPSPIEANGLAFDPDSYNFEAATELHS